MFLLKLLLKLTGKAGLSILIIMFQILFVVITTEDKKTQYSVFSFPVFLYLIE